MKVELDLVDGVYRGFNLVAEDELDHAMLEIIRDMNILANKKAEKICYGGSTLDIKANVSRVIFLQRHYANLPDSSKVKKELYNAILQKGVTA